MQSKTHNQIYNLTKSDERVALATLKLPDRMVSAITKEKIQRAAKQIEEFGFVLPVLVDKNNVVRGLTILFLAAQRLELPDIPIIRLAHLSEEQLKAYTIAEQKMLQLPTWDERALAEEFTELLAYDLSFDIEVTGFSISEIDTLIMGLGDEPSEEGDPAPPLEANAVARLNDVWLLGDHRLLCGSALEPSNWAELMNDQSASVVFTDPPYNVKINGHVSGKGSITHREFEMASGEMTELEYRDFLHGVMEQAAIHSHEGALHYFCIDWRHVNDVLQVGGDIYKKLINLCCWVKPNGGMGSFYRSRHELVAVFRTGQNHTKIISSLVVMVAIAPTCGNIQAPRRSLDEQATKAIRSRCILRPNLSP